MYTTIGDMRVSTINGSDNHLTFVNKEAKLRYLAQQLPNLEVTLDTSQDDNEEAWLAQRMAGLGGSDIGTIIGVNQFACARELYLKKLDIYPEEELSEFQKGLFHFGHQLESIVCLEYNQRTNVRLFDPQVSFRSKAEPWKLVNVDRFIIDDNNNIIGIFEAKTTTEFNNTKWAEGDIPTSYLAQLNWYLHVANLKVGAMGCLVGGNKYYHFDVMRNDAWLADTLVPAAENFWFNNVKKMVEPELDGSDASTELLKKLYPAGNVKDEILTLDDYESDLCVTTIRRLKSDIKTLTKECTKHENRIKDLMGDMTLAETASYDLTWKVQKQTRLDSTRLKAERPDIFDMYAKQIEFKKFGIKETSED